jgi:diguanylate cyclase (GGDEF)-like protein
MSERAQKQICGYAPRLFGYVIAVIAVAMPIAAGAVAAVALDPPDTRAAIGIAVFFSLTLLAELKPVPLDEDAGRLVSLAFVFIVSAQILFGWEYGVLISAVALVAAQIAERRTNILRTAFNAAAYSVAAFAGSLFALFVAQDPAHPHFGRLTMLVFAEGAVFVGLNVLLVCTAVALFDGSRVRGVVTDHLRHSGPAFAIMAFIAALAVALWTVSPPLLGLLAGPVFALALFQRYALRTRVALRAASTDSLTHLPNHRAYESDLVATLDGANGREISLCLLDIDNFKRLNDHFGHPVGDRVLVRFAELLAEHAPGARAYRLGGDEFAILTTAGEEKITEVVKVVRLGIASEQLDDGSTPTFSAGVASFPRQAKTREELTQAADAALYWSKRHGKNQLFAFDPAVVGLSWSRELAESVEYDARLRATESLIRVVDARDTYTGSHSQSVAILVETIGQAMGFDDATVSRLRLAGLLHDVGKIAVPDRILQKPGKLDPEELAVLRKHPEDGYDLLQGLAVDPVDRWILHHHEHWDGTGYPHGLAGEKIPIGSRIILVADAFDAITSDRIYRQAGSVAEALAELRRFAGTQFDPAVVGALERALGASAAAPPELASRVA